MLEPFLMLTVLNCFFMFSSTVTTCALWWQHKKYGQPSSHREEASRVKMKKTKSCGDRCLKDGKKGGIDDIVRFVGDKSFDKKRGKSSKTAKESKKDKKKKSGKRSKEAQVKHLEKLTSTEGVRPSSEAKSTVVMEVSTVQKVVQVFDGNHQQTRLPNETVTYRFAPDNPRKVEFIVRSKSENGIKSIEKIDHLA